MGKPEMLDVVRRARELLARTWIPNLRHDAHKRRCWRDQG